MSEATLSILRGRFKVGLSAVSIKFSKTTALHMADSGRYIPIQIIEKPFGMESEAQIRAERPVFSYIALE